MRSDGTPVKATSVKASSYLTKDKGKLGKGKKIPIKLKKNKMTNIAMKTGFIKEGQQIKDISLKKMRSFGLAVAKEVSPTTAFRMFNIQIIFRKNARTRADKKFRRKMILARDAITKEYPEVRQQLTEAARKAKLKKLKGKK
jgi:hypothetical protein